MKAITVSAGDICPVTGIWSFENDGETVSWYIQGQLMPWVGGGSGNFYLIDDGHN